MACKPEPHYITLDDHHRIATILNDLGQQRYIPQYWVTDPKYAGPGFWESLLPLGMVRMSLREARNDCARHSGKDVLV
jgi:hypothetical protein